MNSSYAGYLDSSCQVLCRKSIRSSYFAGRACQGPAEMLRFFDSEAGAEEKKQVD